MTHTMTEFDEAIARVPDYQRFLTVDEMYERARSVAERNPGLASHQVVGHSTDGIEIPMVRIGDGPQRLLLFACPHPNEPIGAMLIQFLFDELIANEELRRGRSWYLMPCVDPDGTKLNEGWFAGPFTVRNYARHFYRPRSQEQVEWTFPIRYKDYAFDSPIPETQALMRALEEVRPDFVYSLHNAGFGGVYYYITNHVPEAVPAFHALPKDRGLFLSLGEAEMPWAKTLAPAVYQAPTLADAYDHHERFASEPPASLMQGGASSFDYLRDLGLADTVALITEMPYFQAPQIADQSPTERVRREVILEGAEQTRSMAQTLADLLARVEPFMTLDTRFYRTVSAFTTYMLKSVDGTRSWAEKGEDMDRPATVAELTDELYVGSFYRLLIASMLRRAIEAQQADLGTGEGEAAETLASALADLETQLEAWTRRIEDNLAHTPIPIKTLVEVQYGAMLAVLESPGFARKPADG